MSVNRQCELLGLSKGGLYYEPIPETEFNLMLMDQIDRQFTETPFYGTRRINAVLIEMGYAINRKRVQRLMRLMGLEAIYPKKNLSKRRHDHKVYPYLLKGVKIDRPNFVWSTDITYIRLRHGFIYLTAVIDWFSRYILAWKFSNSLASDFCIEAVEDALSKSKTRPDIFNTDQGVQFTANDFVKVIETAGIKLSMDGKGRALDNIFIERFWRSLKYEEVYLKDYETVQDAYTSIDDYFDLYNYRRPHQSLNYKFPYEVHYAC